MAVLTRQQRQYSSNSLMRKVEQGIFVERPLPRLVVWDGYGHEDGSDGILEVAAHSTLKIGSRVLFELGHPIKVDVECTITTERFSEVNTSCTHYSNWPPPIRYDATSSASRMNRPSPKPRFRDEGGDGEGEGGMVL
jgi:hypothetical protein